MRFLMLVLLSFLTLFLSSCSNKENPKNKIAPLFNNLGSFHYMITTDSELAQKYFDQGFILSYAFNHMEAFRSFNQVILIDSNCAMGYWGMALVLGPNINAPMDNAEVKNAYDAIQKAKEHINSASKKERDLIYALEKRYSNKIMENRHSLDSAYAEAMRNVHRKYPNDIDIAVLFAESLMDLHPWDYWSKNGQPKEWTIEIQNVLENVIKKDKDHPGANHLYIHTVEASKTPEKALASANILRTLIPGAGHLVHMPAHIYIRVGKYHEGSLANEMAIKSDEEYLSQCHQQGFYPLAYYPHNYHFLSITASLEGNSKEAIRAAVETAQKPPDSLLSVCGYQTLQHYYALPFYVYVRFGKWDEILKAQKPKQNYLYPLGIYHYARGMAFTSKNKIKEAKKELKMLNGLDDNESVNKLLIWGINSAGDLLKIADNVLAGEIEAKQKNYSKAIDLLQKADKMEDQLKYDEPPTWLYSVEHNLGAVLIEAGKFKEAEKIYRKDLEEFPDNGWALFGLMQSLKGQEKLDQAKEVQKHFKEAWEYSDIKLEESRIM